MARGRKPTPTSLKIFAGNPGRRPLNESEPKAPAGIPTCPDYFTDRERKLWDETVAVLAAMGLSSRADAGMIEAYCEACAQAVDAREKIKMGLIYTAGKNKLVKCNPAVGILNEARNRQRMFASELGLSPAARSKIHLKQKQPVDDDDAFLNRKRA